jgi:glutamyl-tRNA reductase
VVISSTGARGLVVSTADLVQAQRGRESRALVVVDLALPRDVEPGAATVPGVRLLDLAHLGTLLGDAGHHPQVQAATDLVTAEVAEYLTMRSAETVAPTVSALRRRAEDVVAAELTRLARRLRTSTRPSVTRSPRRSTASSRKLLHAPTVRVKEFAEQGRGGSYARALHELFDLDPRDVSLVSLRCHWFSTRRRGHEHHPAGHSALGAGHDPVHLGGRPAARRRPRRRARARDD